jgi:hypothetical protein
MSHPHKDTPESFWERMRALHGDDVGGPATMPMGDTKLAIGGLMRCCLTTLNNYADEHGTDRVAIGEVVECEWCDEKMVLDETGWWRWQQ